MSYLEANLLPLILSIKTPKTDSFIMIAAGLEDRNSQNSVLIQMGNRLECFWNQVIDQYANNLIKDTDKIKVGTRTRQLDHLFETENSVIYYLDSKCNVNFDTEKKPASNDKIEAVSEAIYNKYQKEVLNGYFIPCIREVPEDIKKKYPDINIYGVNWMMNTLKCNLFTVDEFFDFFKEVIGPILNEKLYA